MKDTLRVLIAQTDIVWERPAENLSRIEDLVGAVAPKQLDLLLLPELFASGFTMAPEKVATDSVLAWMKRSAQRWNTSVLGSLVESTSSGHRNTAVLVDAFGNVTGSYVKIHPFAEERNHYQSGEQLFLFEIGGFLATVFICYDLRFPELFRAAVSQGVELFFVIANWPSLRHHHWEVLLSARAIENQAYVCACNRSGKDPYHEYLGGSQVILPDGQTLLTLGTGENAQLAVLQRSPISTFRSSVKALGDRRPDLYRSWDSCLDDSSSGSM